MSAYTFTIPGPPVAKQRPRRGPAGNWYTPKRTTDYENVVAWSAKAAGVKLESGVPYGVQIRFYLSSHRKDIDNCAKSVLDGLQRMGQDWNDSQVIRLDVMKHQVVDGGEEKTVVMVSARQSHEPNAKLEGKKEAGRVGSPRPRQTTGKRGSHV